MSFMYSSESSNKLYVRAGFAAHTDTLQHMFTNKVSPNTWFLLASNNETLKRSLYVLGYFVKRDLFSASANEP